jgi:pimeloyl-ACP methyl ester carboxylesterase
MPRFDWDGHSVDYELRGEGPTVILVHGLTADRRIMVEAFEPVLATAGVRRLYVDLPGHGRSRGDAARASADGLVELLAALARTLLAPAARPDELEAPLVIGYSYGGYLATALVRELGGARGLFLACPVVEPDFARRQPAPRRVAERAGELPFSDDVREREAFDEVAVRMTPAVLARFQRALHPANVVAAVRARYVCARPLGDALGALTAPVSIVCGRDDHWAGWQDAATLVRNLMHAEYVVLPDCGHLLPLEEPERLHELVRAWLRRVAG